MAVLVAIFVADILPIFLIAGVGYLLARQLDASVTTLAHVVFYALVPCLVFRLLVTSDMAGVPFARMAALALLVCASMGVVGWLAAIPLGIKRPELTAFLLVVMISNAGNYGLPVVLFAFGPEALPPATVYFVTSSMLTYTVGIVLAATGRRSVRGALRGVVKTPALYGLAVALVVLASGVPVPAVILRPVTLLSEATLPMMILVLGMQLERATLPARPALVAAAVALSLGVAPLVSLGLASLLDLSGPSRQAGVLLASMPVAVVTTILALEYDVSPPFVTSAVFVSTLLSPVTLTPLIAYLKG